MEAAREVGNQGAGTPDVRPRVAVFQDGARLHYAVPVALEKSGSLERVYTDWYTPPKSVWAWISRGVGYAKRDLGKRMKGRWSPQIPVQKVISDHSQSLTMAIQGISKKSDLVKRKWVQTRLSENVRRHGLGMANTCMGFIRMMPPALCQWCRQQGAVVIGDQMIAPASVELREQQVQFERFKDWQQPQQLELLRFMEGCERETWPHLDHVTCGSEYVKQGLMQMGVAEQNVSVLPYPLEATEYRFVDRRDRAGPVKVGFVGQVGLRKGLPYFLKVASRFSPGIAKFYMVGPVRAKPEVMQREKGNVEIIGAVPRAEVARWLHDFDILLFPSTCEGSPGAVMEAMATGLPVVTTMTSGTVVRDGTDGFVVPYDDIEGLADRVGRLIAQPSLRDQMGRCARQRVEGFSIENYSRSLTAVLTRVLIQASAGQSFARTGR